MPKIIAHANGETLVRHKINPGATSEACPVCGFPHPLDRSKPHNFIMYRFSVIDGASQADYPTTFCSARCFYSATGAEIAKDCW